MKQFLEKTNIELCIGNILPITPSDESHIPFIFGLSVLGRAGGFSGRLMSTIREKEGLTYSIYALSSHMNKSSTGHWNIYTFFTPRDIGKGLRSIRRELHAIVESGITEEERKIFTQIFKNQFLIAHSSNLRRIQFYHYASVVGNSPQDTANEISRIGSLTKKEVDSALKTYINPNQLIISGAGPVTKEGVGIVNT